MVIKPPGLCGKESSGGCKHYTKTLSEKDPQEQLSCSSPFPPRGSESVNPEA